MINVTQGSETLHTFAESFPWFPRKIGPTYVGVNACGILASLRGLLNSKSFRKCSLHVKAVSAGKNMAA